MWQWIAVVAVLVFAGALVLRKGVAMLKGRSTGCGCGGCPACPGRSEDCHSDTVNPSTASKETSS